jgi:inorganic pyrophosphatase
MRVVHGPNGQYFRTAADTADANKLDTAGTVSALFSNRACGSPSGIKSMQNLLSSLQPRDSRTGLVHVVIDTTRGSPNKLKYDENLGCFKLSRILPAGHVFPFDFGSVPGTRAPDGDALDVLVLLDAPTFPGCLVTVKLIGGLAARQTHGRRAIRNDRLIGAPQTSTNEAVFQHLSEFSTARLDEIEHFFVSYNAAQGRSFEPIGRFGPDDAEKCLDEAIAAHREQKAE